MGVDVVDGLVHEHTLVDFPPLVKRDPFEVLERGGGATSFSPSQNSLGSIVLGTFEFFLDVGSAPIINDVPVVEMGNYKSIS